MSLDAMKQALEALEMVTVDVKTTPNSYEASRQAITALRAAIEQKPVTWWHEPGAQMNYRKWQGLTADEIWQCNAAPPESAVEYHICMAHQNILDFAEAIEVKLKAKNA